MLLTFVDNEPGNGVTKPGFPAGFGDNRRVVPFFDVWLPEGWAFTSRGDSLLPHSLFGNGYIPPEKEIEDEIHLISDDEQSGHWSE